MKGDYSIRRAQKEDLEAMLSVFVLAINQTAAEHYTEAQRKEWSASAQKTHRWNEAMDKQLFWVAETEAQIIGFISLENNNYIDFLYVHPEHVRKGIALALYNTLHAHAQAQTTHSKLSSDVSHTALPFFQKQGFQIIRENENERNGEVLVNFRVELEM